MTVNFQLPPCGSGVLCGLEPLVFATSPSSPDTFFFKQLSAVSFYTELPTGGTYKIEAFDNKNPWNCLSTLQVVFIDKHISGMKPFVSPYQFIAADATNDHKIDSFDIEEFRKVIMLGLNFSKTTVYRFIDAAFEFDSTQYPLAQPFPEFVNIFHLSQPTTVTFISVKMGLVYPCSSASEEPQTLDFQPVATPNPFSNELSIRFKTESNGAARLSVFDLLGREVLSETRSISAGENNWTIAADRLPSAAGLFFVKLKTERGEAVLKVVKN